MGSRGVNRVMLIGYLGKDPEIRYMPDGGAVANFSLATTETWKDKQGQPREKTEWHRVVIYGRLAEVAGDYLRKGSHIYIEGSLQTRTYKDANGVDRYVTETVVGVRGSMTMLGGPRTDSATPTAATATKPASRPTAATANVQYFPNLDEGWDDNIFPF